MKSYKFLIPAASLLLFTVFASEFVKKQIAKNKEIARQLSFTCGQSGVQTFLIYPDHANVYCKEGGVIRVRFGESLNQTDEDQ